MILHEENVAGEVAGAIGKGLIAGVAGTAAITLSQMIEMKITKRQPSEAPVKVAGQIMDIRPASKGVKQKVSQEIHWAYGISWGVARGIVSLTGAKGLPAALIHFAAIWGTSMIILPKYKAAPPVTEESPKAVAIDGMHHAFYSLAAGLAFDALEGKKI